MNGLTRTSAVRRDLNQAAGISSISLLFLKEGMKAFRKKEIRILKTGKNIEKKEV